MSRQMVFSVVVVLFGVGAYSGLCATMACGQEIRPGNQVVTIRSSPLMDENRVVLTVERNEVLIVTHINGPWIAVVVDRYDGEVSGWIAAADLARLESVTVAGEIKWKLPLLPAEKKPEYFGLFPPVEREESDIEDAAEEWRKFRASWCDRSYFEEPVYAVFIPKSLYSVRVVNGKLIASDILPDEHGKTLTGGAKKGKVYVLSTMSVNHEKTESLVLGGQVWTPRVEKIGNIELAGTERISTRTDFDFRTFRKSKGVIPFANGYGVNLFGAHIKDGAIARDAPAGSYRTKEGNRLPGRMLRCRVIEEDHKWKAIIEEVVF